MSDIRNYGWQSVESNVCTQPCGICGEVETEAYAEDAERSKAQQADGFAGVTYERSLDTECLVKVTERKGGSAEFVGASPLTSGTYSPKGVTRAAPDGSTEYYERGQPVDFDYSKKGGDKESLRIPKLPLDLIPPEAIEGEARVLAFGAKKYSAHNWKKGLPYAEVLAAIDRHSLAIKKGEDRDPETGELHTWHIKCEASFLGYFMSHPDKYAPDFDNREFSQFDKPQRVAI